MPDQFGFRLHIDRRDEQVQYRHFGDYRVRGDLVSGQVEWEKSVVRSGIWM